MPSPHIPHQSLKQVSALQLLLLLAATVIVYWAGLQGPFLLDDSHNLAAVQAWLEGRGSLGDLLASKLASPYGRPVAMASFAATAAIGGFTPFAFKLGNLLVHLACGLCAFALVSRMANRDPFLARHARKAAFLVTGAWLLHPLNASTVLYAVQRMAQLSTLWMLGGMWAYMVIRERIERAPSVASIVVLAVAMAMATTLGFLSKENGILLPAMCLLLELVYFPRSTRPNGIRAMFAFGVLLPAIAGVVAFVLNPARLLGAYAQRDFGPGQRLLTEARVLCDYMAQTFIPNPSRMGVYTDDFPLSTGLLSPPSTFLAIVVLLCISVFAWRARRTVPALTLGWGIFLLGHALESTFLPLELYFEHRNYLPMIGLLYAAAGVAVFAWDRSGARPVAVRRAAGVAPVALLALLGVATHGRALAWSDERTLVETAAIAHPDSLRAQLAVVSNAVSRRDLPRAHLALAALLDSEKPRIRAIAYLNRLNLDCAMSHQANSLDMAAGLRNAPARLGEDEAESFDLLFANTRQPCEGTSDAALGALAEGFAHQAVGQADSDGPKAEIRHVAARFHARAGDWKSARAQAALAWQPNMPAAASQILIRAYLESEDFAAAERTWREAALRATPEDQAGLRWLRQLIDRARAKTHQQ